MVEDRDKTFPGKLRVCDLNNGRYITRKPIYDFIVRNENVLLGNLLDFGCGSSQYRNLFKSCLKYTGLDVKDKFGNVFKPDDDVVFYDGYDIPFGNESYDSVVAIEVFAHIEDSAYSLREIKRILKPEGILLFTVPMTYPSMMEPYDFRRYTKYGIEKSLEDKGFDIVCIEPSTRAEDTIRRMKIIEFSRKKGVIKGHFAKCYRIYSNLIFVVKSRGEKGEKRRKESKLPIDWMVICRKK